MSAEGVELQTKQEVLMKIFCPHCGQAYEVAEKYLNQTIGCQTCNQNFQVTDKRRCPACGEEILAIAKKCRFCGENLEPEEEKPDQWPVWKIFVALIVIVLIVIGGAFLFGDSVGTGNYILAVILGIVGLIGISIPIFVIMKICEIARNTRK